MYIKHARCEIKPPFNGILNKNTCIKNYKNQTTTVKRNYHLK